MSDADRPADLLQFFDRMTTLLDREARGQGVTPADVILTQDQIDHADVRYWAWHLAHRDPLCHGYA